VIALLACAAAPSDSAATIDPTTEGAWAVGHRAVLLDDPQRPLTVEVFYPTDAAPHSTAVPDAFLSGDQREDYAAWLAAADPDCPTATTAMVTEAEQAAGGPWPAVVLSHCHTCTRFSTFTLAARLASHGIVVVAPDHAGNTLFDDEPLGLTTETLALRRDDGVRALDALLDGTLGITDLDGAALGAAGHSFGSVTAGLIAQTDSRITAAMGIAAPMENPLLPGVQLAALTVPLMFVVAVEDNSITEAGNVLIRSNYEAAVSRAYKAEVADAGHWSFSDLCGLVEAFQPGCGTDERQTDGEPFAYLPAGQGRDIAATLAAAFFLQELSGASGAVDGLSLPGVTLSAR
jgi:dienelactone hydrolase